MSTHDRWLVGIKGGPGKESFEIFVHRESDTHAIASYGWFGKTKLLISHNGGPCRWPVTQSVWDKLVKVANEVANELNGGTGI